MPVATICNEVGMFVENVTATHMDSFAKMVDGKRYAEGILDSAVYYMTSSDEVVPRPSMPLSISGTTISGIPAGSVLAIGEQTFEVDDGEADIEGYTGIVKITCWPYLDAEVTL